MAGVLTKLQPPPSRTGDQPAAEVTHLPDPVPAARFRRRHLAVAASFIAIVLLPVVLSVWYLWTVAAPRYVSYAGFSVRTQEPAGAVDMLGGVAALSGGASLDAEVVYRYISSPALVETVDQALDLRALWSSGSAAQDPLFRLEADATLEELTRYWERMVSVYVDGASGVIDVEVQGFSAAEATLVNQAIFERAAQMVNRLSDDAHADATALARSELERAQQDLVQVRGDVTRFRSRHQMVDPAASVEGQMGLLGSLQQQKAEALIALDLLRSGGTRPADPRFQQAERKIEVIDLRISEEKARLGDGSSDVAQSEKMADLMGRFEALRTEMMIAEESYASARKALDLARAEAARHSRYLAAHVPPTLPQSAVKPFKLATLAMVAAGAFLVWALVVLIGYALRDRR